MNWSESAILSLFVMSVILFTVEALGGIVSTFFIWIIKKPVQITNWLFKPSVVVMAVGKVGEDIEDMENLVIYFQKIHISNKFSH